MSRGEPPRARLVESAIGTRQVLFSCPGCKEEHAVNVGDGHGPHRPLWLWNGDLVRPTFSPSVLVRSGHHVPGQEGKPCWCSYGERYGRKAPFACEVCHSFVTNGAIQFLADCTHGLAGQTVPLPPVEAALDG